MENKKNRTIFRRAVCLVLCLVLGLSFFPGKAGAAELAARVDFSIDDEVYAIDMQYFGDTLYCRADQLAQAADCLWNYNDQSGILGFYLDTPVILAKGGPGEYVLEGSTAWVPFFDNAKDLGLFFSEVKNGTVIGRRATPLAVIFQEMDRIYTVERYRISQLMFEVDFGWIIASAGARGYAILSSGLIGGFSDALSGKMEQDMYNDIFVQMLLTDESLMGSLSSAVGDVLKNAKTIHFLQKAIEEGEAIWELLKKFGFTEKEIKTITWELGQVFYGEKTLNNLSDLYTVSKVTDLLKFLKLMDVITASMEADAGTILAIQNVFGNSSSEQVRIAANRAIGARTGGGLGTADQYTAEYILDLLMGRGVGVLEKAFETYYDISSLENLAQEVVMRAMDQTLSLSDKSDAIRYAEAYSLLQLEIADYYYTHCDDDLPDNGYRMHAVTMLYLRTCYGAYKMFESDGMLKDSVGLALETIGGEITALAKYTEEELYQSGTADAVSQAIDDLAYSLLAATEPETEPPAEPETEPTQPPAADNSHLYQAALDAYDQRLRDGIWLGTDDGKSVQATHYYLFDMNIDGVPEMIAFALADGIPTFHVYTYEQGNGVSWIADSLISCDLSRWYNAGYTLSIYDDQYVFAHAEKSVAAYTESYTALLGFDGYGVSDIYRSGYTPAAVVNLVEDDRIVGGIAIDSGEDVPAGGTDTPEQPGGEPGAVPDGTYHYTLAEYPFFDGNLFCVNLPRESQDMKDLRPGSYGARLARVTVTSADWYVDVEVYVDEVEKNSDGTYRMAGHTSGEDFVFIVESDGCTAIYDSIGFWLEGPATIQWFDSAQLEFSPDCVFRDERGGTGGYGLDMSRDEAISMIEYTYARGTEWVEVTITVENGKITSLVLPYIP